MTGRLIKSRHKVAPSKKLLLGRRITLRLPLLHGQQTDSVASVNPPEVAEVLKKRLHELNALYNIHAHTRMILPLKQVFEQVVKDLRLACRDQKYAEAHIHFDEKTYFSAKTYQKLKYKINRPIFVRGHKRGSIEIGYQAKPADELIFTDDENRLITQLAAILSAHIESRETLERYGKVVDQSIQGVYILKGDEFRYVNPKLYRIFGVPQNNLLHASFPRFVPKCKCAKKLLKSSNISSIECTEKARRADGKWIDVHIVTQKIQYHSSQGVVGMVQDVTRLKQAEDKLKNFNRDLQQKVAEKTRRLEEANRRLQSINDLKDEFISVTSHELRSPLTNIRGYLSMLVEMSGREDMPYEAKSYLMKAYNSVQVLNYLVNNILDVSRIETNRLTLHKFRTDLPQLLQSVIDNMSFQASEKNIVIHFNNSLGKNDPFIPLDEARIRQVIRNILENAIKFSDIDGQIEIRLKAEKKFRIITIKDHGVGIPKKSLDMIFEKYSHIPTSRLNDTGTGLGLFVSQKIIEAHQGNITVKSRLGKGTTFTIHIPL